MGFGSGLRAGFFTVAFRLHFPGIEVLGGLELLVAWKSGGCYRSRIWSCSVPLGLRFSAKRSVVEPGRALENNKTKEREKKGAPRSEVRSIAEQALGAEKVASNRIMIRTLKQSRNLGKYRRRCRFLDDVRLVELEVGHGCWRVAL
eukprot:IDg6523t1